MAAALIDVALLTGLAVILGLIVGRDSVGRSSSTAPSIWVSLSVFGVTISGLWLLVYWALVLLYYFALEATTGQTVGKRLLGLRLSTVDGGRPSTSAIAERTLLRALVSLAVVLTAVVALFAFSAVSVESVRSYRGNGVSFDYPGSWRELEVRSLGSVGDLDDLWSVAMGVGGLNAVKVNAYRMRTAVTTDNLDAATAEVEAAVRRGYAQVGGAVNTGPEQITVGRKPGVQFHSTRSVEGVAVERTDVFFFDGTTEYQIACQTDQEKAAEIGQGCDQILRSFTLDPVYTVETSQLSTGPMPSQELSGGPMASQELLWLATIGALHKEIDDNFGTPGFDSEYYQSDIASLTSALRTCSRELAPSVPPNARLQPVHDLIKQACQQHDKGVECLSTAVKEWNQPTFTEQRFGELLDCGLAAHQAGSKLLTNAEVKGHEITETVPR